EDHTLLFAATFISLLLLLVAAYLYFKKKGGVEPPPNPPTPGYNTFSSMSEQPLPGEVKGGQ
ncbi:MAG: hypothetical protein DRN55_08700, partial [Thermoplasmata archaeon]